jgi:hypothetical protein
VKRSILLALFATLALAVGVSPVAVAAGDGSAHAAKKGKGCKGKKGKAKGCKGKGKGQGGLPLSNGTYTGQEGVGLIVKGGGKQASLKYAGDSGKTCVMFPIDPEATSVTSTSKAFTASSSSDTSIKLKWSITVKPGLKYTLVLDSSHELPGINPCDKPGVKFSGTLAKTG